jgi:hypothetical protein
MKPRRPAKSARHGLETDLSAEFRAAPRVAASTGFDTTILFLNQPIEFGFNG